MLNELKRYIKYNSEKLNFLKLRNKFFDRLRNRGFRKYTLSKLFSAVKYSSRNKLLATNDTMYYCCSGNEGRHGFNRDGGGNFQPPPGKAHWWLQGKRPLLQKIRLLRFRKRMVLFPNKKNQTLIILLVWFYQVNAKS